MKYTTSPARILLAIDYPGWAFHNISSQMATRLGSTTRQFQIACGTELHNEDCDLLVCFRWRDLATIKSNNRVGRTVLCLYDHLTWCQTEVDVYLVGLAINECDVIAVANEQIADTLRARKLARKPIFVVEDGVNTEMFQPMPFPPMFAVGWVGNSQAGFGGIKGLDLVREACEIAKAELRIADMTENRQLSHAAMPAWYGACSLVVCASKSEGTPNPVLEAMACGRPVVTTRVGITQRLVAEGINGWFVERSAEAIAAGIERVRKADVVAMGAAARVAAEAHSWEHKIGAWRACIEGALSL